MSPEGLPSPDPVEPEAKLAPAQSQLRAPRPRPARYNGKLAALLAGATAIAVTGALFAPALLGGSHRSKPREPAPGPSQPAPAPIQPISYGAPPADPATGAAGVDCGEYPGMPGCAAKTAAAAASASASAVTATAPASNATAAASAPASAAPSRAPGVAGSTAIFFSGPAAVRTSAPTSAPAGAVRTAAAPSVLLPIPPRGSALGPPSAPASEVLAQNGQGEKAAFVRTAAASPDYVAARLQRPRSPYEVKAGAVLAAALLTAINSDLPGEVIAQVSEPVYDHVTGRYVLIPQGARLIGRYDAQVAYGQTRVLVAWRRLIFPNGDSLDLGSMAASDPTGQAGLSDRVDGHFGQLTRGIVLSTLLSMGAASTQDAQARSSGTLVLNSGASGAAGEADQVGSRLAGRDLNRQPTLVIRQGAEVRVLVDKDLILEPYS